MFNSVFQILVYYRDVIMVTGNSYGVRELEGLRFTVPVFHSFILTLFLSRSLRLSFPFPLYQKSPVRFTQANPEPNSTALCQCTYSNIVLNIQILEILVTWKS